ncbi:hypothetical protein [Sorangium sp. So ce363]|uniref:hypothetical protein n=1 Tax=Sorangium sp. So ce363 TaxID=3133304 RepID=UPI003F5F888E
MMSITGQGSRVDVPDLGSFHSAEIKFVLGSSGQLLPQPLTGGKLALSQAIMGTGPAMSP